MLCMISGGIDLSVVAIANLAGILSSMFLVASVPPEAGQAYGVLMLLAATLLATFLIPMFFLLVEKFANRGAVE